MALSGDRVRKYKSLFFFCRTERIFFYSPLPRLHLRASLTRRLPFRRNISNIAPRSPIHCRLPFTRDLLLRRRRRRRHSCRQFKLAEARTPVRSPLPPSRPLRVFSVLLRRRFFRNPSHTRPRPRQCDIRAGSRCAHGSCKISRVKILRRLSADAYYTAIRLFV